MNDLVRFATSVELATGKKRGRHPVFSSSQFYPYAAERRLQNALRNELEDYIGAAYGAAVFGESFKTDSMEELALLPEGLSDNFKAEISYAAESIARKVSSSIAEMTEMTVGKPYYPQAAKESLLKDWESNFQVLCVSAESDAKKDIARLVTQAKNEGWNGKQLEKAVMKELPDKYANRASLIARTESAKLNTSVTLETYKEIGCKYYMWMATLDERVRPDHAMMNGLICSATDPTVWYEENPDDPMHPIEHKRDDTMVHLHPGDDFQCRCTMVMWDPVIDGKYEVKERQPEEEPEGSEEKTESDPASRELEKANERLAEKEKELETTKAELKSANEELSGEKAAREATEKVVAELETENAILKTEKATAEKRTEDELHRRKLLQKANERHSKRSVAGREEIQMRWEVRRALPKTAWDFTKVVGVQEKTGVNYREEVEKRLKNRSQDYRVACRLVRTKFQRTYQNGKFAKFLPKENKIMIGPGCAFLNKRGPGSSLLHEDGHALDKAIGDSLGYGGHISVAKKFGPKIVEELTKTLFQEADMFIAAHPEFEKGWSINRKREIYFKKKFIEAEYLDHPVNGIPTRFIKTLDGDDHEFSAFADIINGVSQNKIDIGYHHSKPGYWDEASIGKESFTHIGTLSESELGVSLLEAYLPENYNRWKGYIRLGADEVNNRLLSLRAR
ncbi:minor capsid protein [Fibrobacter sp.]|uniref:phage head morphogenesis protein n=1 Tax=Fibrobacter sp. TaxID=35828 RepID=UPI00386D3A6C